MWWLRSQWSECTTKCSLTTTTNATNERRTTKYATATGTNTHSGYSQFAHLLLFIIIMLVVEQQSKQITINANFSGQPAGNAPDLSLSFGKGPNRHTSAPASPAKSRESLLQRVQSLTGAARDQGASIIGKWIRHPIWNNYGGYDGDHLIISFA